MTDSDIDELRETIEKDLAWRNEEITFLSNILNNINGSNPSDTEKKRNVYRKSLILSLYAHFEGFFRYSFETYAYAINESKIEVGKVIDVLCASGLNREFLSYEDSNKWIIPADEFSKTHRKISNRVLLLENIEASKAKYLELPLSSDYLNKTSIVHTESNLKPEIIDKILYSLGIHQRLGLNRTDFLRIMGLVSEFVKKRNGIAHGDNKSEFKVGVSENEYNKFFNSYERITNLIGPLITKHLKDKLYLKPEYR
ncbi:MAE_28990/MAE_18760 family HEPN-like nuclease [Prolixibacter sp. NT017]|uniref:MAE_28990/MAE_18760 family HEPN-like nuclease n=1 Tax=Prolixibacter sp. NT017 TaxID=2652390 RepID=UPI00127669BD|nr:MAE_28990/MAE_18760 family HEPN-like nuclease [Prolixibacter sp. NT017]GET25650.1 hypothetical protein NT017_19790 [Prolixibacter sp. NT017]